MNIFLLAVNQNLLSINVEAGKIKMAVAIYHMGADS
jgi:hypothetical protein